MATDGGLRIVRQYSDEGRKLALRAIRDPSLDGITATAQNAWLGFLSVLDRLKEMAIQVSDPNIFYEQIRTIFHDEISRNNALFVCVGLGFGTACGFLLGLWLARPHLTTPVMRAIACVSFGETDNVTLGKSIVPRMQSSSDILVRVRAVSIHRLDARIASNYGRQLRRILQRYNNSDNPELPLVIGRACAGVIEAVGRESKSGLEIGDEVWLVAPWYEAGLASELVVAPESRVGRKPVVIGFEAAASLPYSGCMALSALRAAGLNEHTCADKRILVQDGCSPVGCVITQLAKKWGAFVTATCNSRTTPVIRALGADDVIVFQVKSPESFPETECDDDPAASFEKKNFATELAARPEYNFIFITTPLSYNFEFLNKFLLPRGLLIDTVEPDQEADGYGLFFRLMYSLYVRSKTVSCCLMRTSPDWGGPHLCHLALDRLAGYVNDNVLQTVVDQVYTPNDAELAMAHICSSRSIGNTIITFR